MTAAAWDGDPLRVNGMTLYCTIRVETNELNVYIGCNISWTGWECMNIKYDSWSMVQ